tara:strand:- start:1776 stop:2270 length:495 start_codon:yes stop_codon:yes gene_type:complete
MEENKSSIQIFLRIAVVFFIFMFCMTFSGCGTYYLTDAEYSDAREEHTEITYWNDNIYWGFHHGFWYYYGQPHTYPWWYYYQHCPNMHYSINTHITVVNNTTRPNRPNKPNRPRPNINSNTKYTPGTNFTNPRVNTIVKPSNNKPNRPVKPIKTSKPTIRKKGN